MRADKSGRLFRFKLRDLYRKLLSPEKYYGLRYFHEHNLQDEKRHAQINLRLDELRWRLEAHSFALAALQRADGLDGRNGAVPSPSAGHVGGPADPATLSYLMMRESRATARKRIAVVSVLPPLATGIANATARTFSRWAGGVDYFSPFDQAFDLLLASTSSELGPLDRRVFDIAVLPAALVSNAYELIVFVVGNSDHNVPVVRSLLALGPRCKDTTMLVYVHDPVLFNVIRRVSKDMTGSPGGLLERVYGRDVLEQAPTDADLVRSGLCGVRVLSRLGECRRILVNSRAAMDRILMDDPTRKDTSIEVLFHPVFAPIVPAPRRAARATWPRGGSLHIGSFGIATGAKGTRTVIAAAELIEKTYGNVTLTLAGYEIAPHLDALGIHPPEFLRIVEAPSEKALQELMTEADLAVQLRPGHLGESSGIVCQLIALGVPTVVSNVGAFKELGRAVWPVDVAVSPEQLASQIVQAFEARAEITAEATALASRLSSDAFCRQLATLIEGLEPHADAGAMSVTGVQTGRHAAAETPEPVSRSSVPSLARARGMRFCHAHIPKTGGSALNRHVLMRSFPDTHLFRYDMNEARHRQATADLATDLRGCDALCGHLPYGFLDGIAPEVVYLSLFRNPDTRFLSMVTYVLANQRHGFWRASGLEFGTLDRNGVILALPNLGPTASRQRAVMVRLAAGFPLWDPAPEIPDEDLVGRAIANLRKADYVWGLQEEFPSFVARLTSGYGLTYSEDIFLREGERASFSDGHAARRALTNQFSPPGADSPLSDRATEIMRDLNGADYRFFSELTTLYRSLHPEKSIVTAP